MDQLVQCPVCTLFLHNGMSLETHLDTHPKDQVIKALCSLSASRSNYGSRASTPMHSERSYRSRSRTPATEDAVSRWNSSMGTDAERYWHRSTRTPKTSTVTRCNTPSERAVEAPFDASKINNGSTYASSNLPAYQIRTEKVPQQYHGPISMPVFDSTYSYNQEQKEEKEIKYSRSAEYNNSLQNPANNAYVYSLPSTAQPCLKVQSPMLPATPQKRAADLINVSMPINNKQDFIKILPKSSNIALVKTNVGSMQYIAPGVMVSGSPAYIPKNQHTLMAGNMQAATNLVTNKTITNSMTSNQLNHITSTAFAPNTTVVTQNSQIIYREMVHNIDGKPFMPGLPAVLNTHENVTNVAQASSLYQNVMLLDQFGNTSCMYATPQLLPKAGTPVYNQNMASTSVDKNVNDPNKTLIIEVSPIKATQLVEQSAPPRPDVGEPRLEIVEKVEPSEGSLSAKGLKILSNIKVEVPVQHNKNLVNKVVDLTGPVERAYTPRPDSPERILPDLKAERSNDTGSQHSVSMEANIVSNTFSVIKNVGNPPSYKESKNHIMDSKMHENESSDSCPVPDLICNEKPSISPCSDLTDHGDNSMPHAPASPKPEPGHSRMEPDIEPKKEPVVKTYKQNPLRLNNIFVKKSKKVLQIKNAKSFSIGGPSSSADAASAGPSHAANPPENFTVSKARLEERLSPRPRGSRLETVSIERIPSGDEAEFDADTEERSMDLEPEFPSAYTVDLSTVKDEASAGGTGSGGGGEVRRVPFSGHFDEDDEHRELLDLEAASKNKHLVSMMNDHYFGDNIYADYFTPEREEARGWGEGEEEGSRGPSSSNEFVLPTFIHESYKVADGGFAMEESKAALAPLDICADERMPPRGELSGESADMEPEWSGIYPEVPPAEAYDLMARESWVSDASDADSNDRRDQMPARSRMYSCGGCGVQLPSLRELRAHRVSAHPPPAQPESSAQAPPYRGIIASGVIKKEERPDDIPGILPETAAGIASSMLEVYSVMAEAKPKLEVAVKQEPRRRRRDYVCPTCKVDQLTDVAFHEHLKVHPLECLTCGKLFRRRANLALHMKTHLGIKNHKCELCEKRFVTRQKLLEHFNVHTGRAPVRCTHCDRAFRRYSNMVQHRDRHHLNKKPKVRDFVCQCGEVYHSRAKLRWHRETHDAKPKACPHCADKFLHASSLTRHVRRMHNAYYTRDDRGRNDNVACPVCKQVYLRSNLKTHLRTHSGKRPYSCVVCNKAFTTQWNLKLHRWTHASRSAKPYKCTLCKGAFIRQSEYVSHMNAHKSVRPYTCNYCGCQFIRKYNCQRHVKEHEQAKKYVCKVPDCGKTFHRSYYLSEHMKVHSGARPFACNICGKTSSNKSNHNKHVKIHHAREPVATEA